MSLSFSLIDFLISLVISSLTYWLFRSMLYKLQLLMNSLNFFLLLISNLLVCMLCSENILFMISCLLNLLRLVLWLNVCQSQSFPGGSDGRESSCNAGDLGLIPGLGRSPGKGNGCLLQYFLSLSLFFF